MEHDEAIFVKRDHNGFETMELDEAIFRDVIFKLLG